jgi:hypothetical protein
MTTAVLLPNRGRMWISPLKLLALAKMLVAVTHTHTHQPQQQRSATSHGETHHPSRLFPVDKVHVDTDLAMNNFP